MSILKWRNDRRDERAEAEGLSYEEARAAHERAALQLLGSARNDAEYREARHRLSTVPDRALDTQTSDRFRRNISDNAWSRGGGRSAADDKVLSEIEEEINEAIRNGTYDRDDWYR